MARFADRLAYRLAIGLGSGLIKPAPGTWGSLTGALLFWGLLTVSLSLTLLVLLLGTVLGAYVCRVGGESLGELDHGSIVWDEIMAIGWLLLVVYLWQGLNLLSVALAFVLFRLFDILKPWPIERVDGWHTPWGVMLDDLLAAVYAGIGFFSLLGWLS